MPLLKLNSPSCKNWAFGDDDAHGTIDGEAVEFCLVITQTYKVRDTGLSLTGEVTRCWMANTQCFEGPPETPPQAETRFMQSGL